MTILQSSAAYYPTPTSNHAIVVAPLILNEYPARANFAGNHFLNSALVHSSLLSWQRKAPIRLLNPDYHWVLLNHLENHVARAKGFLIVKND